MGLSGKRRKKKGAKIREKNGRKTTGNEGVRVFSLKGGNISNFLMFF